MVWVLKYLRSKSSWFSFCITLLGKLAYCVGSTPPVGEQRHITANFNANTNYPIHLSPALEDVKIDPTNAAIDLSFCQIGIDGIPNLLHFLSQRESTRCQGVAAEDVAERSPTREAHVVAEAGHSKLPLELSLRECSLGDVGVASLAESSWFCGSEGAKVLSLRHNQDASIVPAATYYGAMLLERPSIHLDACHERLLELTASGSRALFASLRELSEDALSCLQLDFNPLGDAGVQPLPAYLKQRATQGCGGLEELSLRFCGMGPAGCRYLSSALIKSAASASSAQDPPMSGCAPASGPGKTISSGSVGEEGKSPREKGNSRRPSVGIRRLLLTGNRLGDDGARSLASALKKNRSLEVLDLTRCHVGDDGAKCLADTLRSNTSLRELRLDYNNISPDGANALATLLGDGPGTLEILELGHNRIGDDGAAALAKGLEIAGARDRSTANGKGLLRLGLAGNGIGWVGGCALAKSLSGRRGRAPELQELELAGNTLTLTAAKTSHSAAGSSLYKSAGGAITSLLNQLVDEAYLRGDAPSSTPSPGNASGILPTAPSSSRGPPEKGHASGSGPRCGVLALGAAIRQPGGSPSLRKLGLARTGITEVEASKLARALRHRPAESPLEDVEIGMNGLHARAVRDVRSAVEDPGAPTSGKPAASLGSRSRERHGAPSKQTRGPGGGSSREPPRRRLRTRSGNGNNSFGKHGIQLSGGSRPQDRVVGRYRRDATGNPYGEQDAFEGEAVKGYVPPAAGKVELRVFGRKVASFGEASERREPGIDVEVFGKRARFESPSSARSSSTSVSSTSTSSRTHPTSPTPSEAEADDAEELRGYDRRGGLDDRDSDGDDRVHDGRSYLDDVDEDGSRENDDDYDDYDDYDDDDRYYDRYDDRDNDDGDRVDDDQDHDDDHDDDEDNLDDDEDDGEDADEFHEYDDEEGYHDRARGDYRSDDINRSKEDVTGEDDDYDHDDTDDAHDFDQPGLETNTRLVMRRLIRARALEYLGKRLRKVNTFPGSRIAGGVSRARASTDEIGQRLMSQGPSGERRSRRDGIGRGTVDSKPFVYPGISRPAPVQRTRSDAGQV